MSWPDTADGDVFRRLQSSAFDFKSTREIDFNVDFESWPPSQEAVRWLEREYECVVQYPPEGGAGGYLQFKVAAPLTYDLVVATQDRVSRAMAAHAGVCESWGVLQSPE